MKRFGSISILALLIISGCSPATIENSSTPNADAMIQAAESTAFAQLTEIANVPTSTPIGGVPETVTPTVTLPPATITSTSAPIPQPVAAVANNNVTVRSEPRKGGDNLGGLFFNQGMQVIARNDNATWYYIEWPKSPTGAAWVTAVAVDLKNNDPTRLPIAILNAAKQVTILPPLIWDITGDPLPLNPPAAGAQTARINQFAKVRVGPGLGYSTMGTLDAGTIVAVTGRLDKNAWVQIEYPSGPGGRGWLSGELIEMQGAFAGLPFYNLLATPIVDPDLGGAPVAVDPTILEPTLTPQPTLAGPTGEITGTEVNVRSGPASSYDLIGTLKLGDPVVVTGQTLNGLWYRIVYAAGPGGHAWVAFSYIKITGGDMRDLRYFNDQATPIP